MCRPKGRRVLRAGLCRFFPEGDGAGVSARNRRVMALPDSCMVFPARALVAPVIFLSGRAGGGLSYSDGHVLDGFAISVTAGCFRARGVRCVLSLWRRAASLAFRKTGFSAPVRSLVFAIGPKRTSFVRQAVFRRSCLYRVPERRPAKAFGAFWAAFLSAMIFPLYSRVSFIMPFLLPRFSGMAKTVPVS